MRSWLYTPANTPSRMINAGIYGSDGVVFDLEDSIAPDQKDEARFLLEEMLPFIADDLQRQGILCRLAVRINGLDTAWWQADLSACLHAGVQLVRVPKVESQADVHRISAYLDQLEAELKLPQGTTKIQALLETPLAVEYAFLIASASARIVAFSFGAEDYCAALGLRRKEASLALDYPRSRIASAAAAFGLEAYDSVWGFLDDQAGLIEDAKRSRSLGFCGKSVIHPNQIKAINEVFSFSAQEVEEAQRIVEAVKLTSSGVLAEQGRMVDKPVVLWARRVLEGRTQ